MSPGASGVKSRRETMGIYLQSSSELLPVQFTRRPSTFTRTPSASPSGGWRGDVMSRVRTHEARFGIFGCNFLQTTPVFETSH